MPVLGCFWKGTASIKLLLLEKTDFSDVSLPAHLLLLCVACLPTRAPMLSDWHRHLPLQSGAGTQKRWSGAMMGKEGGCGLGFAGALCASSPMWVAQRSHHRPSKVSFVPCLCPHWLSQLWHSSAHPSAPRCDFQLGMNPASPVPSLAGSAGALPAMSHYTENPFSICMGSGGVEGKRGEGCVSYL